MKKGEVGKLGEIEAARYLREKGFQILCANYHTRLGEIDIIASDRCYLVFVEVKTRCEDSLFLPREAVDKRKQLRIIKAAGQYLASNKTGLQPRFDVVEVITAKSDGFYVKSLNHIVNAFSSE